MRVVLDSNVLVAGFAFGGICRAIVDVCIDSHELIISEHILSEVHKTLVDKLGHSVVMADERINLLKQVAIVVSPSAISFDACRDPNDLPVLGTMLAGNADCLVTGDHDLLCLKQFGGRSVLSPREFWESLSKADK